jgi:hypothetical protein
MIPASAVIAGRNMSTSSALAAGFSVLATAPVTRMSFVAVRALTQDNTVETPSQGPAYANDSFSLATAALVMQNKSRPNFVHFPK